MWTLLCCFNSQKSRRLETQELIPGAPPDQRGPNHLSIAATPGACTSRKLESKAEATRMRAFPRARQTLPAQHFQQVFRWVLSYYSSKSRINAEVPVPLRIIYTQGAQVPWDTTYGFAAAETLSHTLCQRSYPEVDKHHTKTPICLQQSFLHKHCRLQQPNESIQSPNGTPSRTTDKQRLPLQAKIQNRRLPRHRRRQ